MPIHCDVMVTAGSDMLLSVLFKVCNECGQTAHMKDANYWLISELATSRVSHFSAKIRQSRYCQKYII